MDPDKPDDAPLRARSETHPRDVVVTERALSFGSVATAYERFRPGYPEKLVDEVLSYAGRPVRSALEIGAGTGKATRVFAGRGIAVTATDPDPAMLAELRTRVPTTVTTMQAAFEDLQATATYDLVFAAASLHWTSPTDRWARVAALLDTDGVFASFGGQLCLADAAHEESARAARAPFVADDGFPSPEEPPPNTTMKWPGTELARSALFVDIRQSVIERRTTMPTRDYIGHLSTISAYLMLPTQTRANVFERILEALPAHVPLSADLTLHLARLA